MEHQGQTAAAVLATHSGLLFHRKCYCNLAVKIAHTTTWESCADEIPPYAPFSCLWCRHNWRGCILLRCLWQAETVIYCFSLWYWAQRVQLRPDYAAVTWACNTKLSLHAKRVSMAVSGFVGLERSHLCKGKHKSKCLRNVIPTVAVSVRYHQPAWTTKLNWAFVRI